MTVAAFLKYFMWYHRVVIFDDDVQHDFENKDFIGDEFKTRIVRLSYISELPVPLINSQPTLVIDLI